MNMPDFYRTLICDSNMTEEQCNAALYRDALNATHELWPVHTAEFVDELRHQCELRGVTV